MLALRFSMMKADSEGGAQMIFEVALMQDRRRPNCGESFQVPTRHPGFQARSPGPSHLSPASRLLNVDGLPSKFDFFFLWRIAARGITNTGIPSEKSSDGIDS
ncbi:uncharacterized protein BJX67DRAFT_39675 [Aspergillus lucknowensis]|uniref:Uncharacterized protein n=1 Tax=Aspergillus lucknowensis TaxID=176173 RepID=A0ABR4LWR1_9EURO